LTRVWDEESDDSGVRFISQDPGDMDTAMHAAAVPDADRTSLKRPEVAARELVEAIAAALGAASGSVPEQADAVRSAEVA
jgi:hypothetical protein